VVDTDSRGGGQDLAVIDRDDVSTLGQGLGHGGGPRRLIEDEEGREGGETLDNEAEGQRSRRGVALLVGSVASRWGRRVASCRGGEPRRTGSRRPDPREPPARGKTRG
jgi:hypothetical protein